MSDHVIHRKVLAFLLLLPLGLMLYPALQWYRVTEIEHDLVRLPQQLEQLRHPPDTGESGRKAEMKRRAMESRTNRIEEKLRFLEAQPGSLMLRRVLSISALLGAFGAFVMGLGIVLKIRVDSDRAHRSFDYLLDHLGASFDAVSRMLLWHIGLMLTALTATALYEVAWTYTNWATHGYVALAFTSSWWGAIWCTAWLFFRARRELAPLEDSSVDVLGRVQTRDDAPGLWKWIDGIARKLDVPRPDHIVVGLVQGFFVTSTPVRVEPQQHLLSGRTLYIPLTFASVLSQAETAAIIGHELGHFSHNDTDHGAQLSPLYQRMRQKIDVLIQQDEDKPSWFNRPAIWASVYYLDQFDRAYHHWSRQQELAADQVGARVGGPAVCASALIRVTAVSDVIEELLADPRLRGSNLLQALQERLRRTELTLTRETLEHTIAHPIDTHPPTRTRLEALAVSLDQALLRQATRKLGEAETSWLSRMLASRPHAA
ncbi:M48 family metallopeptidase [Archangium violaceum]|uniref:M48 family metallopeptidase n=1 Tax=Archangium violaceum TaxID=83451 RepID=UPI002B2AA696|nr:M48 family metallopeptidase [Archangium gephyra]